MGYDFDKQHCDICSISKEMLKKNPIYTGNAYPYEYSSGFQLGFDGSALCWTCHKEKSLKELFAMLDARKKKETEKVML